MVIDKIIFFVMDDIYNQSNSETCLICGISYSEESNIDEDQVCESCNIDIEEETSKFVDNYLNKRFQK